MAFDVQKYTAQYVKLRDHIKTIMEKQEQELEPYKRLLDELNAMLLKHLDGQKVASMKTTSGTVYVTEHASASVADGQAFFDFVQKNAQWDLIERRANVTAVRAYIDALIEARKTNPNVLPAPPPGVNFNIHRRVGVRRS